MAISLVENAKKKEGFIDFTPYFNKIKHKLIWCLAVVIVAAVASFILTRFMSSSYTATATVLFKAQSQDVSPLPRLENYDSTRSDYYETKYALMGSRVVLDAAVRKLKLEQDSEFNGGDNLDETARINNAIQALQKPDHFRRAHHPTGCRIDGSEITAESRRYRQRRRPGLHRLQPAAEAKHLASGAGLERKNDGRPENQNGSAEGGHR